MSKDSMDSAADQAAANVLRDQLTCPVCLDIFKDPRVLPCHHTLCFICFNQIYQQSSVQCPSCRLSVTTCPEELPQDFRVQSQMDFYNTFYSKYHKEQRDLKNQSHTLKCYHCRDIATEVGPLTQLNVCSDHHNKEMLKLHSDVSAISVKLDALTSDFCFFPKTLKKLETNLATARQIQQELEPTFRCIQKNLQTRREEMETELENYIQHSEAELSDLNLKLADIKTKRSFLESEMSRSRTNYPAVFTCLNQLQLMQEDISTRSVDEYRSIYLQNSLDTSLNCCLESISSFQLLKVNDTNQMWNFTDSSLLSESSILFPLSSVHSLPNSISSATKITPLSSGIFSFAPTTTTTGNSTFSFTSNILTTARTTTSNTTTTTSNPAFSFGRITTSNTTIANNPAFSFGRITTSNTTIANNPAFSFGLTTTSNTTTTTSNPAFSFASNNLTTARTTTSNTTIANNPPFSFGSNNLTTARTTSNTTTNSNPFFN